MRMQLLSGVMVAVGLIMWSFVSSAQTSGVSPSDALVDVMVWGADLRIDANAYSPEVKAELEKHLKRSNAYRALSSRNASTSGRMSISCTS
jgi:hypothetical protein